MSDVISLIQVVCIVTAQSNSSAWWWFLVESVKAKPWVKFGDSILVSTISNLSKVQKPNPMYSRNHIMKSNNLFVFELQLNIWWSNFLCLATEFWERLNLVTSSKPMPRAQTTAFIFSQFTTRLFSRIALVHRDLKILNFDT